MILGDKKMRAPRLEGDWSQAMRDFVTSCLNEEPSDRLPSDELSKHRWIKGQAKTPLTTLHELITKFQAWKESGGQRQSLAPGVGARVDDEEGDPIADWSFDVSIHMIMLIQTVKSRMSMIEPTESALPPQSLRRLFPADPFESFPHQQPSTPSTGPVDQPATFDTPLEATMDATIRQRRNASPLTISTPIDSSRDLRGFQFPHKPALPRSQTTPSPRPLMMRQASVAVMEGRAPAPVVLDDLAPPKPSFAIPMARTRSGSRAESESAGLKDILKVSSFVRRLTKLSSLDSPDNLPPSPSTLIPPRFYVAPSPLATRIQLEPPPLRPLDLGVDESDVFTELERTIEDMKGWLDCIERGLDLHLSNT